MSICERPTIPVVMVNCFRIGTRKKLINYCKCLITFKYREEMHIPSSSCRVRIKSEDSI